MADLAMDPVPPGDAWQRALTTRLTTLRALPEPPSFGPAATEQFLARLAAEAPRPAPPQPQRAVRWPTLSMRLAGVALALLLALLGTGYAAAASLPGAPLYPLKRQAEELRVAVAAPDARDDVRRMLLEVRRDELSALVAQQAPAPQVAAGVAEYADAVTVAQAAEDSPVLRAQLREHQRWLSALDTSAAPAVVPLLEAARQTVESSLIPELPGPTTPVPAAPSATATPHATPTPPTPRAQPTGAALPVPAEGDDGHPARPTLAPPTATRIPASPTAALRHPPAAPPRPRPPTARPLPATAAPEPPGPGPTPGSPPEPPGPGPGPTPGRPPESSGPGPESESESESSPEPSGPGSPPEAPGPGSPSEPSGPGPGPGPETGSPPEPPSAPTSVPEPPGPRPGPDGQPEPGGTGGSGRP